MKRKYIFVIFYFCLFTFYLEAQPTQEWIARYERPAGSSGIANQMALDKVGNCYVLGNTAASGGVIVLIKYNSSGDTAWTRTYPQSTNVGVVADSVGNVYITGYFGPSFGPYDIITIKYNPAGILQWQKIYDSGLNDQCSDIEMDKAGNIYIGGLSGNQSLIIKYNISGDTLWTRKYSEINYRFPVIDLHLDSKNNIYITGNRLHTTNSSGAQFTIKYDSNAVFKWINNPLITNMQFAVKLGVDNTENVYVTGSSFFGKILTIKYDINGNQLWEKIYDGPGVGTDRPSDLKINSLGNIVITGLSTGIGTGGDFVTILYNTSGDSLWVKTYNGIGNGGDIAFSLKIDNLNNIYITGGSLGNFSDYDFVTIKYNLEGIQQWLMRYPNEVGGGGISYNVMVDNQKNLYITGLGNSSGINGYITIKYSQTVGNIPIINNLPNKNKLEQNYPNPFNPKTKIKYQIVNNNSYVELFIFDIMGKEITRLVNRKQNAGYYEVAIDAGDLSSGIYFYRIAIHSDKLITERFTETKKMILIK
ncbi:MAG: PKD repeat protein [Chlorobi bacterium OLB5]|nr:MAG: PKD repeat protein [Chlorobi bacterium OLB5]